MRKFIKLNKESWLYNSQSVVVARVNVSHIACYYRDTAGGPKTKSVVIISNVDGQGEGDKKVECCWRVTESPDEIDSLLQGRFASVLQFFNRLFSKA